MIKLPTDKYGNQGWVVQARKPHRCDADNTGCARIIEPGTHYYRAIMFPGEFHDGPGPWVMKICRACLHDEMGSVFDALIPVKPQQTLPGQAA